MKPGIKTRHEIYKRALEIYMKKVKAYKKNPNYFAMQDLEGLCSALLNACKGKKVKVTGYIVAHEMDVHFPEIFNQRPARVKTNLSYWWVPSQTKKRIDCLERAIELTKPINQRTIKNNKK